MWEVRKMKITQGSLKKTALSIVLTVFCVVFNFESAFASIKICNNISEPVFYSRFISFPGKTSENSGYFVIKPNKCVELLNYNLVHWAYLRLFYAKNGKLVVPKYKEKDIQYTSGYTGISEKFCIKKKIERFSVRPQFIKYAEMINDLPKKLDCKEGFFAAEYNLKLKVTDFQPNYIFYVE